MNHTNFTEQMDQAYVGPEVDVWPALPVYIGMILSSLELSSLVPTLRLLCSCQEKVPLSLYTFLSPAIDAVLFFGCRSCATGADGASRLVAQGPDREGGLAPLAIGKDLCKLTFMGAATFWLVHL